MNRYLSSIWQVLFLALGFGILGIFIFKISNTGPLTYEAIVNNGGIGFCLGLIIGMSIYHNQKFLHIQYYLNIVLRYTLAYFIISYGLQQALGLTYPDYFSNLELKLIDMAPDQMVRTFFGYSKAYQSFIGWIQLLACVLLFFRQTVPLALIILSGVFLNIIVINFGFNLSNRPNCLLYSAVIVYLFIPFITRFVNFAILNRPVPAINYHLYSNAGHGYKALNILKLVMVSGIIIYFYNPHLRYQNYYNRNAESPVVGVWNIESIKYDTSKMNFPSARLLDSFETLFLEKMRYGKVKAGDTLSRFDYMIDTTYHQLEFWNFLNFKDVDLKGKYQFISPDTMIYIGRNNKEQIQMKLSLDKRYRESK